jgi:nickel superoxide dismutase
VLERLVSALDRVHAAPAAEAHCDAPCGVYDPASARIAAEAVLSLTKKILALQAPTAGDAQAWHAFHNTMARYIVIKEEQAEVAKRELLILWTDFFKPEHLAAAPDLHERFWKAAKLCSECKQTVNEQKAGALLQAVHEIHDTFWAAKKKDVAWYTAS